MTAGAPTKYTATTADLAYKFCLLGASDEDLARSFEVDVSTISKWKNDHVEFSEAIKKGKDQADAEIASKLYHRAKGYEHAEVDVKMFNGEIILTDLTKHYPPDTAAAIFWLKNRQKNKWRDKHEVESDLKSSDGSMTPKAPVDKSTVDEMMTLLKNKTAEEAQ